MRLQVPKPFVVVLTGGVASGKSTVSKMFESRGVPVIDADVIAHELVEPGEAGLSRVIESFGESFLTTTGELNRSKLRSLIFSDDGSRRVLESIIHPLVWSTIVERLSNTDAPYCLVVIPLFVESKSKPDFADRILVVDVDEAAQYARLIKRDNVTTEIAESMLNTQATREARLKIADDVITNDGSIQDLQQKVNQLHRRYFQLATSKHKLNEDPLQ